MSELSTAELTGLIRDVPDWPEPGIVFKDITPLLADRKALSAAIAAMASPWRDDHIDAVVGIEARGFILGAPVAMALGVGFVPVRKQGKLPGATASRSYGLEYGADTIEIHADALRPGQRVVVLDDVLATGGTAAATGALLGDLDADVVGWSFLLELGFLGGRAQLPDARIESLMTVEP